MIFQNELLKLIKASLKEDIGKGDITGKNIPNKNRIVKGRIVSKSKGILAGIKIVEKIFKEIDKDLVFYPLKKDGDILNKSDVIAKVEGKAESLFLCERTVLNFLQHLSGIATLVRKYVDLVEGTNVKIYDTRKTLPNLRLIEKYAVRVGGGYNHRFGLYDGILIKKNHLKVAGSIKNAVSSIRKKISKNIKIEVEASNIKEVKEAIESKVDIIMLDNMKLKEIKKAVNLKNSLDESILIEVSGGVNFKNVKKIANSGVDRISIGLITNSSQVLDASFELE